MAFIKLTGEKGEPILLNIDNIEAIQPSENGVHVYAVSDYEECYRFSDRFEDVYSALHVIDPTIVI